MKRSYLLLLASVALIAVACGGAEASDDVASLTDQSIALDLATSDLAEIDSEAALLAFTACMRDNDVDLPDPELDSDGNISLNRGSGQALGVDRETIQAAFEACGDLIEGVTQQFARPDITDIEDQLLAFAQCMRDEGIDMDDPDLTVFGQGGQGGQGAQGGQGGGPFGDIDLDDPAFQAASDECQEFLPNFGAGGRGGGQAGATDNG